MYSIMSQYQSVELRKLVIYQAQLVNLNESIKYFVHYYKKNPLIKMRN